MTDTQEYDAIVIGTGQSGPSLAGHLNHEGLKTAIIERKLVGGTCVNENRTTEPTHGPTGSHAVISVLLTLGVVSMACRPPQPKFVAPAFRRGSTDGIPFALHHRDRRLGCREHTLAIQS